MLSRCRFKSCVKWCGVYPWCVWLDGVPHGLGNTFLTGKCRVGVAFGYHTTHNYQHAVAPTLAPGGMPVVDRPKLGLFRLQLPSSIKSFTERYNPSSRWVGNQPHVVYVVLQSCMPLSSNRGGCADLRCWLWYLGCCCRAIEFGPFRIERGT